LFIAATGRGDRHDTGDFIGVWSIHDKGDAPARWTIGKGLFRDIRGIAIDPKTKTVIASDKNLNAVLTFYVPEIFDGPQSKGVSTGNTASRCIGSETGGAKSRFKV